MINHVWTVLCTRGLIDRDTNNISLLEVIEQIVVSPQKFDQDRESFILPINCEIVTLWTRGPDSEPDRGRARLYLQRPGDGSTGEARELDVDLTQYGRTRMRVRIAGIQARVEGLYVFHMQLWDDEINDWHDVAQVPLQITFTSPEQVQETTPLS